MEYYLLFITSLISGVAGAIIIKQAGYQWGLVDIPNDRSSHERPTPKGGGIGILVAFIIVAVWEKTTIGFWAPIALLALMSLLGDRHNLSAVVRLIVQVAAGIIVLWSVIHFELFTMQSSLFLSVFMIVFFLIFITGTANIYNFMDGINGIATVTGIMGFSLLAWYASNSGSEFSVRIVCIALVFACLGFLPFNMPNAKVFMGDVGSILLGFVFAVSVVMLVDKPTEFFALAACLFPFYADELTTMYVRIKDGERLSRPHRRHLYQLLANEMGIDHWKVSMGYGLVQLLVGYSAINLIRYGFLSVIGLLCCCFIVFTVVSFYVRSYVLNKL